jgi:plasmid stabilization system protein ParE
MYTLEYLPIARRDMIDIAKYIGVKLANPDAAERLAEEMIESVNKLTDMPYRCAVYTPVKPLKHEYRKLIVRNYIMLYRIDEDKKLITVARVIYAGRDYEKLLD